jgi:hypothetical protein
MRHSKYFLVASVLLAATISLSFLPESNIHNKTGSFIDHYSIDPLPETWKQNKSLINAIDKVITTSVEELAQSIACTNCTNSPYSVSLIIDSPVIIKQTYGDIGNKKNSGGFNYECITVFRFKSSLAVYDINQRGVAKVMITNPEEDEYTFIKKFNLFHKTGVGKLTPEEYISKNPAEVLPAQTDLMKYAEKKIYRLRDDINKLYNRH